MIKLDEYLNHCYVIPEMPPFLPLADEVFVAAWKEVEGKAARKFLTEITGRELAFPLQKEEALRVFFVKTLGGQLPVVVTGNHDDFLCLEALLNGRNELDAFPATVNAFTLKARAEKISDHRVILLGQAPYSNVPAHSLGLTVEEWLERSFWLRLAHECAHYETLRLFGNMENHALDEIVADTLGQLAAFGSFSAERQRLFFGLEPGTGRCFGRLSFYCRGLFPWDRAIVYRAADKVLDSIEEEINVFLTEKSESAAMKGRISSVKTLLSDKDVKDGLLTLLAGTSIVERWEKASKK